MHRMHEIGVIQTSLLMFGSQVRPNNYKTIVSLVLLEFSLSIYLHQSSATSIPGGPQPPQHHRPIYS